MPGAGGKRKRAELNEDSELVALHRARIINWSPTAVTALAATADGTVVAVARESGSIEIWNTEHWQWIKRLPGREKAALSCLAWTQDKSNGQWRLFSGGLDGVITEWDLSALRVRAVSDSYGGAVWSMAVEPEQGATQRVAVACDDGALRIFEAQQGVPGLQYAKTLPRTGGRVLSAAWHPTGTTIVTGTSVGVMHVWQLSTNRELLRITAGSSSGVEHCIWSVLVLPDGSMVSGDSSGSVQLWDGQHGTRLQAFTQHKADVLAVAASPDGNTIFATGIDVQVACFKRIAASGSNPEKWVYLDTRRPHTHDVRAMLVLNTADTDPLLLTGGNDTQLFAYSVPHFQTGKNGHSPLAPVLSTLPTHIAHIKKTGSDHIICGALSPDGSRVAFSDRAGLHLYQLSSTTAAANALEEAIGTEEERNLQQADDAEEERNLQRADGHEEEWGDGLRDKQVAVGQSGRKLMRLTAPEELPTFHELQFRPGSSHIVGLTAQGVLCVVDMDKSQVIAELSDAANPLKLSYQTLGTDPQQQLAAEQLAPCAALLTVSPTGRWAAVAGSSHVHVFDLDSMSYHGRLPAIQDSAPLTALAFDASGAGLITATASNHLAVYNVESLAATEWTKLHGSKLPARLLDMPGSIASISPHPQTAEIVVATPSSACHISLLHQPPIELKTPPRSPWGSEYPYQSINTAQDGSDPGENFRVLPMQHPVLLLAYTSPSSLLLVDKPWEEVYRALPEPLYRHRYGT